MAQAAYYETSLADADILAHYDAALAADATFAPRAILL